MNSPHKGPVTRKMFPFDDGIMFHLLKQWKYPHAWNTITYLLYIVDTTIAGDLAARDPRVSAEMIFT